MALPISIRRGVSLNTHISTTKDGSAHDGRAITAATTAARGTVAQGAAPAVTSTVAAGTAPTKAEFDALRADLLALQTSLRNAGIIA